MSQQKRLREIDRRYQSVRYGLGIVRRERFVMDALEAYLALSTVTPLELGEPEPSKLTNAISESTEQLKTGRYEP